MDPKELATYLRVSPATIRNWRQKGVGPPWVELEHNVYRYRRSDIGKWLEEKASGTTESPTSPK